MSTASTLIDALNAGTVSSEEVARSCLDRHLVAVRDQLECARRCQRDAVLVGLDLLDDPDLHGARSLR